MFGTRSRALAAALLTLGAGMGAAEAPPPNEVKLTRHPSLPAAQLAPSSPSYGESGSPIPGYLRRGRSQAKSRRIRRGRPLSCRGNRK